MLKKGFYDSNGLSKIKPMNPGWIVNNPPAAAKPGPAAQPARPREARVVPLPSKDYLRFLHPNAFLAAGFDFGKMLRSPEMSPEIMKAILGAPEGPNEQTKLMAALREMDHFWLSLGAANDGVLLMTGKFEQGATAGLFYAQGVMPVFLGDAHAMMIGSEPSIQAALARMAKPAAGDGWVTRRARELARDHESWMVTEHPAGTDHGANQGATLQLVRRFALGFRLSGTMGIDGEAITDSDAGAQKIAAWLDEMKAAARAKTGVGALDALKITLDGATLRFAAKDDGLLTGEAGKTAMSSDFGVELHGLLMGGFPGKPPRTVAEDKIFAVHTGMKREDVLSLLGPPVSVTGIQGLAESRETWTYQVPFGKQVSLRLQSGVVSEAPR